MYATALELRNLGLDVRGNRQVEHDERGRAARDRGGDHVGSQHRVRCRGRADHHVDRSKLLGDVLEVHRRPPRRPARTQALWYVRFATDSLRSPRDIRLRAASSDVRPAPTTSAARPVRPPSATSARLAATEATETFPAEIAVSLRARLPVSSARWNARDSTGPAAPSESATLRAVRTCPSTCASPGTSESRPAATRFRCSDAVASVRR